MKLTAKQQTVFEIVIVLGVMLLAKDILDRFNAIGAGSIAMWIGIFVATFFMKKQGVSWQARGLTLPQHSKEWFKSIATALLITVTILVFMALVMPLISELLGVVVPESASDRYEFFLGKPLVFIAYLLVVIWLGAALGEELLMRGFLLNSLINFFGNEQKGVIAAVVLHAFIFGLLHISQGVPGIIGTGIVAVIFATVYLFNGRKLFPLILAHGLVNSIGLIAYYVTDGSIT